MKLPGGELIIDLLYVYRAWCNVNEGHDGKREKGQNGRLEKMIKKNVFELLCESFFFRSFFYHH